jgi:hypothetical protein
VAIALARAVATFGDWLNRGGRATINLLHVLTYAERATGRPLITIPPSGILITLEQRDLS